MGSGVLHGRQTCRARAEGRAWGLLLPGAEICVMQNPQFCTDRSEQALQSHRCRCSMWLQRVDWWNHGMGCTKDMSAVARLPCPFLPLFLEPSTSMSMSVSMSLSVSIHCHKFAAFSTLSFTPSFSLQMPIQPLLLNGRTQQVILSHPEYFHFYSEPHPGTRG